MAAGSCRNVAMLLAVDDPGWGCTVAAGSAIAPALDPAPGASPPLFLDLNRLLMAGFPVARAATQHIRFLSVGNEI